MTNQPHSDFVPCPWWEEFPELLEAEAERFANAFKAPFALYNDPREGDREGIEEYCRGRFVWRGTVTVRVHRARERSEEVHSFTLDFVYPETYPYLRVTVIPVEPRLRRVRHQHPVDDYLCYLRENPNDWYPGITNLQILGRVKNWLMGHVTNWTLAHHVDIPELPLYFHYDQKDTLNLFLFDHCYEIPPGFGRMYLLIETKGRIGEKVVRGVVAKIDNLREREERTLPREGEFPIHYFVNDSPSARARLVKAVWCDLPREPAPFRSVAELIDLLSQSGHFGSKEEVTAFIKSHIDWERHRDGVYIGVRYPVRQGGHQWAVFRLNLGDMKALAPAGGLSKKERKRLKRTAQFEQATLRLVPTHPLRHVDLFRRVGGVCPVEELRKKRVAIVGLGALGAPAALLLSKAGVGAFRLCDDDRMLVGNVTRHPSDLRDVPVPKCLSILEKTKAINPFANVTLGENVTSADRAAEALRDADLAVVAIADESIELLLNSVAIKLGKTVFYARAMQQMKVGRVIRVTPGETACLVCLQRYRERPSVHRDASGSRLIEVPALEGDEVYDEGCGFAAIPGAAVDTEATANLLARTVVDWLLGRSGETNQWVLVNQPASGTDDPRLTSAPSCHRQTFLPLEECATCGEHGKEVVRLAKARAEERRRAAEWRRAVLLRDAYEMIVRESAQCGRLETGGVLLGRVEAREGTLIIAHATGPGPNAVHQEHHFLRDARYCQAEIDRVYAESGGSIDYVGEWHKHREAEPRLSRTDHGSLVAIAASPSYQVSRPIMLICGMPAFLQPEAHKISGWTAGESDRKAEAVVVDIPP